MIQGIDVSHWSGEIDWSTVRKQANAQFAICKCTEGTGFLDDTWKYNRDQCLATGMPLGAYHFYRNNGQPDAQADWFLKNLGVKGIPVWADVETIDTAGVQIAKDVKRFLERIRAAGYKVCIYTSPSFWKTWFAGCDWAVEYPLWIANYEVPTPTIPAPWSAYGKWNENTRVPMWQYTDKGTVVGVPELGVDVNYWSLAAGDLYKWFGNGKPYVDVPVKLPDYVIVKSEGDVLRIRTQPMGTIVGTVPQGVCLQVFEQAMYAGEVWYRVGLSRWVAGKYTQAV